MTLREARLARGLSQEELGRQIGVDGSTISRWERGITTRYDPRHVAGLADALGLPPLEVMRMLDPTWNVGVAHSGTAPRARRNRTGRNIAAVASAGA